MAFEETDSSEMQQFDEILSTIQQKCGSFENVDRCDHALKFAECFDLVIESFGFDNLISLSKEERDE